MMDNPLRESKEKWTRAEEGEGERGAKRRATNVSVGNENHGGSYFCTRRTTSINTAIIRVPILTLFAIRSSQDVTKYPKCCKEKHSHTVLTRSPRASSRISPIP